MSENDQQAVEIIAPEKEQRPLSASARLLTQFQKKFEPGQSGNPGGRPRLRLLSAAAREQLAEVNPKTGLSHAEEIVAALVKKAKSGDVWACRELREWSEGKLPSVVLASINHQNTDNLTQNAKQKLFAKLVSRDVLPEPNQGETTQ